MGEKNPEMKKPTPIEVKPTDRQIPDKTAKAAGSLALKGAGKK